MTPRHNLGALATRRRSEGARLTSLEGVGRYKSRGRRGGVLRAVNVVHGMARGHGGVSVEALVSASLWPGCPVGSWFFRTGAQILAFYNPLGGRSCLSVPLWWARPSAFGPISWRLRCG